MYNHCSVPNCNSLRQDVKFHVFPCANIIRLTKWLDSINSESLRALSIDELRKLFVCHKHFEKRFITSKSRLLGNAYPTLFTDEEITSGLPAVHHEDFENRSFDHTYTRKRHHDHTYFKSIRSPLGPSQHTANLQELPPSTSKSMISEEIVQCCSKNETFIPMASTSNALVATEMPTATQPEIPCVKELTPFTTKSMISEVQCRTISEPIISMPSTSNTLVPTKLPTATKPNVPCVKESECMKKRKRVRLIRKVSDLSPKCKKIYEEYKISKQQMKNFKSRARRAMKFSKTQSFELLTKDMNEYSKKLFWMQIKMSTKSKKARRFTLEEKIISLSILKQSPKCYNFLRKIFILPSRTTLKALVSKLNVESGINAQIFQLLKEHVQTWKEEKKYCSIIFDEMALEPGLTYLPHRDHITGFVELNERKNCFADHALVFMAKGAIYNWKQPLAFYFCEGATSGAELKIILKEIVKAVGEAGLIPIALISDQGAAFQSALKTLQQETRREQVLSNENTDNVISLSGFTLNVIYDPPHLIKGIRNNFLTKDVLFENQIAKWSDIVQVYKADSRREKQLRLMPKLNDEHVVPEKIKKMKVKNCVQVFSRSTASALAYTTEFSHFADGTPVSKTMKNTSNVVEFLDNLFDSVNGSTTLPKRKKSMGKDLPKAVTSSSRHHTFWREAIIKLKTMKFIDKNNKKVTVPSINNWTVTLESFIRLWKFFESKGIKVMRPRYLNSDSIENFFGQVRAYNSRSNNPNCHSFINTFKSLLITGFISFHKETFNCENDKFTQLLKMDSLFVKKSDVCTTTIPSPNAPETLNVNKIIESSVEEARQERLNVHTQAYTSGWVVRKILDKVKCEECKKKLTSPTSTDAHKWIELKEYKKIEQHKLIYPSECTVRSFGVIHKETNEYLELNSFKFNTSRNIKVKLLANNNFNDITCELHQSITINLFLEIAIKLIIFHWCGTINNILKGTDIFRLQQRSLPLMQNKAFVKFKKRYKKNK